MSKAKANAKPKLPPKKLAKLRDKYQAQLDSLFSEPTPVAEEATFETPAELMTLRVRVAELEATLAKPTPPVPDTSEVLTLRTRVAELEAALTKPTAPAPDTGEVLTLRTRITELEATLAQQAIPAPQLAASSAEVVALQKQVAELESALAQAQQGQPPIEATPAEAKLVETIYESEEHWRLLSQASAEGVLIHENGKIVHANSALGRIFGYENPDELVGHSILEFVAPESQALVIDYVRAGREEPYELIGLRRDGARITVESTGRTIKSQGKTYRAATIRDITAWKRAEEELFKFKMGIEQSTDAIFITDIEGRIIYANPGFEKVYGFTVQEAVGQTPRIIKSGVIPAEQYKHFWEALLAKHVVAGEIVNKHKDGRLLNIQGANNPIVDANGQIIGFLAIHHDVSDRKQTEARLFDAIEHLDSGFVMYGPDERLVVCNTRYKELYPKSAHLMTPGTPYEDILHESYRQGNYAHTGLSEDEWVANRLALHRATGSRGSYEQQVGNRWIRINDARASDGGVVSLRTDITASKQAEEALRVSESHFRAVTQSANYAIITADSTGLITDWNQGAEQIFGYTAAAITGQPLTVIMPERYRSSHNDGMQRVNSGGEHHLIGKTVEVHGVRQNGEEFPLEVSLATWKTEQGNFYTAIINDITERKQAEEALRTSEANFRALIENAPEAIVVVDLETGLFADPNENAVRLYGLEREALIKVGPADMSPPTQPDGRSSTEAAMEKIGEAMQGGNPVFEWIHRNAQGVDIPCEVRLTRLPTVKPMVRASVTDITTRKQAEEALQRSEEKYRTILENMQDGFFEVDLAGSFTLVNDAQSRHLGYTKEELIGMNNRQYADEENAKKLYQAFNGIYRTGESVQRLEYEIIKKDKTKTFTELSASLIRNAEGKPIGFRGITRDIAERKRTEGLLTKRAAELQAVADISTAASAATHVQEMLEDVVNLAKNRFNFYHAHIYLLDETNANLVLTAGAGEVGKQMVSAGRSIPVDHPHSLVARAARTRTGAIANDVTQEKDFLPNPLLPNTRSELATPILVGNTVLGVFDVQSDVVDRFSQEDVAIETTLARQIGAALQNIRSLEQSTKAEANFRTLVENAPEAIVVIDLETGLFTDPNENAVRLYGLARDKLVKVGPAEMSPPTQPDGRSSTEAAMEKIGEAMQGGNPVFDWIHRNAQGVDIPCEVRLTQLPTAKPMVRASVTDITVRKQAEEALRLSEASFRTLIENAPEAIAVIDLETGLFTEPNENAVRLYGLDREALIKVGPAEMSPPTQPDGRSSTEAAMEKIGEAMQGGNPVFEWIHRNAQGIDFPCEVRLTRLPAVRPLVRVSVTDITARKEAEALIAKRAAELQAVADISTAASAATHAQEMLEDVVNLAKNRFNFYHAHIYLLDETNTHLVLTVGAGEVGKQMVSAGRAIPVDHPHSLVARAARTRAGAIANDVTQEKDFLPNPLLPNTRSELATPILIGNTVLGVFDVQSDIPNRFSQEDVAIETTLARQLGAALQTIRSLEQSEKTLAELNALTRRLVREGWQEYQERELPATQFVYHLAQGAKVSDTGPLSAVPTTINTPLAVRGEVIGDLTIAEPQELTEAQEIAQAVAERLSAHIENLRLTEQTQVALTETQKRAVELQAVSEVTTATSTIMESQELLERAVALTQRRFGLYHCHVFLFDHVTNNLNITACGWREGDPHEGTHGKRVIALIQERSLVAQAARDREPILVNDVVQSPNWLPNELLPETRSEIAIPMTIGDTLVGVFDVQSEFVNRFTAQDVRTFTTLANALTVAVQNANLYAEQIAAVARLKEIDQLKSSFLANMSHELRTPLNSIIGFTEVLLEGIDGDLTEPMENDLKVVHKNGQHLLNLINDVLDMAKIEAGRMTLTIEEFNLQEVVEEVFDITRPLADAKALELKLELKAGENLRLEADRIRLRQVLINIVNNSIKFTDAGYVSLQAHRESDWIKIMIKDTGVGIPPSHLTKVFQEFTQVDNTTTRKAGGTGLGLPISHHLVELHGGRLWAESTGVAGEGSQFYIELPLIATRVANE